MASTMTQWEVWAIKPAAGTNLITNPSFETGTTGYSVGDSVITQVSTTSRFGAYALKCESVSGGDMNACFYGVNLSNAVTYTFSAYVKGVPGRLYAVRFGADEDPTTAPLAETVFVATGNWQRRSVTWQATSSATFYVEVWGEETLTATPDVFYTDGWQLETGTAMTTYIDGDLDAIYGHLRGVREYYWTGTPHASTSKRIAQTSSGGEMIKLSTFCKIIAIIGLGLPQINALAADITTGGGLYQGSRMGNRDIEIKTEFTGETPGEVAQDIAAVAAALDNTSFPYRQPLRLYLTAYDAAGTTEQSETTFIDVAYTGGLEGGFTSYKHETKYLTFRQYDPAMQGEGYATVALDWQDSLTGDCVVRVGADGTIDNAGVTVTTTSHNGYVMAKDNAGGLYLGGLFLDLNSVAAADNIAYKAAGGTWAALGAGLDSSVKDIEIGFDGKVYICGGFANAGGIATADLIARWTGSAYESITPGGSANDGINAIAFSRVGHLYAGGRFTTINGVSTNYIARYDGTNWNTVVGATALPTNGFVYSIIPDPWGDGVIIGGAFTNVGGDGTKDYLLRVVVTGTTYTYELIGGAAPNGFISSIAYDTQSGRLYVQGGFTAIGSAPFGYIAYYDGSSWRTLGSGLSTFATTQSGLIAPGNGNVYTALNATAIATAGGVILPDSFGLWSGNQWSAPKFNSSATAYAGIGVFYDSDTGDVYWLGTSESATVEGRTTITNTDYGDTYPTLVITGPGTVYGVENYSNGDRVDFNNLTLIAGEYATIVFGPDGIISASAQMGAAPFQSRRTATRNLIPYIVPGSSATLTLVPGDNTIGLFIYGSTNANTAATLSYPTTYRAIEASVR